MIEVRQGDGTTGFRRGPHSNSTRRCPRRHVPRKLLPPILIQSSKSLGLQPSERRADLLASREWRRTPSCASGRPRDRPRENRGLLRGKYACRTGCRPVRALTVEAFDVLGIRLREPIGQAIEIQTGAAGREAELITTVAVSGVVTEAGADLAVGNRRKAGPLHRLALRIENPAAYQQLQSRMFRASGSGLCVVQRTDSPAVETRVASSDPRSKARTRFAAGRGLRISHSHP